ATNPRRSPTTSSGGIRRRSSSWTSDTASATARGSRSWCGPTGSGRDGRLRTRSGTGGSPPPCRNGGGTSDRSPRPRSTGWRERCPASCAGWRAASHELVAYCDDDVWVDPGWADGFVAALAARPRAAFATGRIAVPPGQTVVGLTVSILDRPTAMEYDASTHGSLGHAASM